MGKDLVLKPFSALGVVTTPKDEELIEYALQQSGSPRCNTCGGCKFNVRAIALSEMTVSITNGTVVVYKRKNTDHRLTRILDCADCGAQDVVKEEDLEPSADAAI
jgi:ribosomal protein L34E